MVATAFDEIALRALNEEFIARWHPLSRAQRAVLRAIADKRQPSAADTLRAYGIATSSTAAKAIAALIDRQILIRDGGSLVFDSPFFLRWVAANSAPKA